MTWCSSSTIQNEKRNVEIAEHRQCHKRLKELSTWILKSWIENLESIFNHLLPFWSRQINVFVFMGLECVLSYNSAISSFTLHNITPLITLETQYKFYDGGTNYNTTWERQSIISLKYYFDADLPWLTRELKCIEKRSLSAMQ